MTAAVVRAIRWFGRFLWDFLIGDTPELALATGVLVGVAFLLDGTGSGWERFCCRSWRLGSCSRARCAGASASVSWLSSPPP